MFYNVCLKDGRCFIITSSECDLNDNLIVFYDKEDKFAAY